VPSGAGFPFQEGFMGRDTGRKERVVGELADGFGSSSFILLEHQGVSSGTFSGLRRAVRGDAVLRVTKGTLGRIAAARAGLPPELSAMIRGPVAVAFVEGDIAVAARELTMFREHGLSVKGGFERGRVLSAADVLAVAAQGSRPQALAKAAGAFRAPLAMAASALRALERSA
jgi:ribosomal protein L10